MPVSLEFIDCSGHQFRGDGDFRRHLEPKKDTKEAEMELSAMEHGHGHMDVVLI
jgi:hypothetical protein